MLNFLTCVLFVNQFIINFKLASFFFLLKEFELDLENAKQLRLICVHQNRLTGTDQMRGFSTISLLDESGVNLRNSNMQCRPRTSIVQRNCPLTALSGSSTHEVRSSDTSLVVSLEWITPERAAQYKAALKSNAVFGVPIEFLTRFASSNSISYCTMYSRQLNACVN